MKIFLVLFICNCIYAEELILQNIMEKFFTQEGLEYIIEAKTKKITVQKFKLINLFNIKKTMASYTYYNDGVFLTKNVQVSFDKAYFFEGKLYMSRCYTVFKAGSIKSKETIYKKNILYFKNLKMQKDGRIYHKFKYIMNI